MPFGRIGPADGPKARRPLRRVVGLAVALGLVCLAGGATRAASREPARAAGSFSEKPREGRTTPAVHGRKGKGKGKGNGSAKGKARTGDGGLWFLRNPTNVVPNQQGKITVFSFRNDQGDQVSTQVGQLLEARGLEVVTGMRPVDSPDHYRDVATHLDLVAFVDGDVRGGETQTKVTVRLRSGLTGRPMSQAIFTESRANLARELSDNLWKKLGSAVARACADGDKPRKLSRNTLRINAGTPIETVPASAR